MSLLTRRSLICASAATLATALHSQGDAAEGSSESEWAPAHVNLAYLKSQEQQVASVMDDLTALFPRRVPIALDKDVNGLPAFMFFVEIVLETTYPGTTPSWIFLHDPSGSFLLATDTEQLSLALKHLQRIARKGPARDDKHPAYPKGIPLVVHLPVGITTSMPVRRVT